MLEGYQYQKFRNGVENDLAARGRGVVWARSTRAVLTLPSLHEMTCREKTQQKHEAQQPEHRDREHAGMLVHEAYCRYRIFSLGPDMNIVHPSGR